MYRKILVLSMFMVFAFTTSARCEKREKPLTFRARATGSQVEIPTAVGREDYPMHSMHSEDIAVMPKQIPFDKMKPKTMPIVNIDIAELEKLLATFDMIVAEYKKTCKSAKIDQIEIGIGFSVEGNAYIASGDWERSLKIILRP